MNQRKAKEQRTGAGDASKPRLLRLKIHKWRNILPGTELRFADGVHALIGKNGTGKTTLLKLISMCARGDFEGLGFEEADIEYQLQAGKTDVQVRIARRFEESLSRFMDPKYGSEVTWEVAFHAAAGDRSVKLRSTDSGASCQIDRGDEKPIRFRPGADSVAPVHLIMRHVLSFSDDEVTMSWLNEIEENLFLLREATRLDESASSLAHITGSKLVDVSVHRRFTISVVTTPRASFVPREMLEKLSPTAGEHGDLRVPGTEIAWAAESVPFLERFVELTGFTGGEVSIRRLVREVQLEHDVLSYGHIQFLFSTARGDAFTQERLSFGQQRLLSFLYHAACNPSVLIADELTNGLHHEWIEACMAELEKRQSFVATQNPLLLDYMPVSSAKDAETAFLQCRLVEQDGKQWMQWRNTTPEEAERFWKSYETGVQFISEILRTEGLW